MVEKTVIQNKSAFSWECEPRRKTMGGSAVLVFPKWVAHPLCSQKGGQTFVDGNGAFSARFLAFWKPAQLNTKTDVLLNTPRQSVSPVSFIVKLTERVQSRAFAISARSFSVKLSRFILLCRFWGLISILLASSASEMFPRFTKRILIFSASANVITSP